jgi:hypothetical protein
MKEQEDDDLEPALRDGFAELRRTPEPGDLLEEKVVRALRARGLLRARRPGRRLAALAAAAAASLLLFFSGLLVGRSLARPESTPVPAVSGPAGVPASAAQVPPRQVFWF